MVRKVGIAFALTVAAALLLPAVPAAAGGGCHSGATEGTGDTIEMLDACFTPSVLRIDPGDSVTFINKDPMVHNVGGNLWGHYDDMYEADVFTATFDAPGIYPFACNYHPGMTGAIVVGDGTGAGNGERVSVSSFEAPEPVVEVRTVREPASRAPVVLGWTLGAAIGIGAGAGIGALLRRANRTTG